MTNLNKLINLKIILQYGIIFLLGLSIFATKFDAQLYHHPIGEVISIETTKSINETDQFRNKDKLYTQTIRVKILNTKAAGKTITLTNQYTLSCAMDEKYEPKSQVFLSHHQNSYMITGQKRDTILAFMVWLTISLLIIFMKQAGVFTIISVIINISLLLVTIWLDLNIKNINVIILFGTLAVVMALITLSLALGFNRQMLITFLASIGSVTVAISIASIILILTHQKGLQFDLMDYITQLPQPLFIAETIIAALGAIMDEATDIIATQYEMLIAHPNLSRWSLYKAGQRVGQTIMGALTSVLFLIFIAEALPMSILYLRNGNSWGYTLEMNMVLGLAQTIIAGIGIVLTVPIASGLMALLHQSKGVIND
ncbi:YibE/F family protein [Periweissella beninensis]|uniref:YibE/F family protein n=1 Tax=Periweissella beninensis TaxID=504936 RepID=A0ABT0VLJ8_9LACO|nr:YibE/F family protein [Periweissella beninensis]MBM7544063.1 putative membrane protein [Periweissella beninensis]MCM2437380.1 YibE/F family protein [Periweissella beninensis]MCT4396880.1 YibE/F family protein [Periweissella beninensis]